METMTFELEVELDLEVGRQIEVAPRGAKLTGGPNCWADWIPTLRVGDLLTDGKIRFLVEATRWVSMEKGASSQRSYILSLLCDVQAGTFHLMNKREGYTLAWVTLSDKGAVGKRIDESGPLIGSMVGYEIPLAKVQGFIIPDEARLLKGLLVDLALNQGFDLILTTGGTGVGFRDITPEATLSVIEKRLPGFERAMTSTSLLKTPHGAISRAVAGTLGDALIVNMPGSPRAVAECLEPILPTFKHTLEKLQGDPSDCAALRK